MNKTINSIKLLLITLLPILTVAQDNGVKFTDVTQKAGIDFRYNFGDYTCENILESSGSRITVFDYTYEPRMLVGIGKNDSVGKVEIVWNDGDTETIIKPRINKYYSIKQGIGILKKIRL